MAEEIKTDMNGEPAGAPDPETNPVMPETGAAGTDPFTETTPDADTTAPDTPAESEEPDIAFKTQFEQADDAAQANFYDGNDAAAFLKDQQAQAERRAKRVEKKLDDSNKRLRNILIAVGAVAAVALIAIIILVAAGTKKPVIETPPEPQIQIVRPDAVGMKKAGENAPALSDPGELSLALSDVQYQPEDPAYLNYFARIPSALQLYHGLGNFRDLNKFQADAATYAAMIRSELMEPLKLFHDIRYTDYKTPNHEGAEFIGSNYSILSGTDYYQTHNYEMLIDSDGCQDVTYSYTFNLKNTARIEEYDFTEYLTCLRVLTGYDITNSDVLYLIRVSMNNFNTNGSSKVQVISADNDNDYILVEQNEATGNPGAFNFLITARKTMKDINPPEFSTNPDLRHDAPEITAPVDQNPSPVEIHPDGTQTTQNPVADPVMPGAASGEPVADANTDANANAQQAGGNMAAAPGSNTGELQTPDAAQAQPAAQQ